MSPRKHRPSLADRLTGHLPWLITIIAGGLFNTGVMFSQFAQIKEQLADNSAEQKSLALKVGEFREKQIGGLQDIKVLQSNVQNLDSRVLVIERIFIEKPVGKK